jgi:exopolysaccharide biosynthesis polyprenyl glycosylphosphotransferase
MNKTFYYTKMLILIILIDVILINAGFILSFLIRYGMSFPEDNFLPYKQLSVFLTLIYLCTLTGFGVYKSRFRSSWNLFGRIIRGLITGILLTIFLLYVFRARWGAFPTSILVISFWIHLLLIFKANQIFLKFHKRIKKKVVVIGEGDIEEVAIKKALVERCNIDKIQDIPRNVDIDEIIICGKIPNEKDMSLITYLAQKMNIVVVFSTTCYVHLLSEKIHGNGVLHPMATFVGKKQDVDEFLMKCLDILGSLAMLFFSLPFILIASILIKLTSKGPVIYTQERVGKDGKVFTLYKFRTMVQNAEIASGPILASENDPRVTSVGRFLRDTRIDELPQLANVILGQMSLVGPRPERPYFVKRHKSLMEIRLAVKPGLTGFAQVRNAYDLHPRHKIKYDYLYIQRRSLLLNLYILSKTVFVVLSRKGQ